MGSKNRTESATAAAEPIKIKKSKKADKSKAVPEPVAATSVAMDMEVDASSGNKADTKANTKAKMSRKRAADFMEEDAAETDGGVKLEAAPTAEEPAKKKSKKSKKDKTNKGEPLTADGVNGVVEHTGQEEQETATTQMPIATSMQAEAERTADHELEDEFGSDGGGVEVEDNAAALLAGFDSDGDDNFVSEKVDADNMPSLPDSKKTLKKLKKAKSKGQDEDPGAVYVGRIPHGFYEKEMRAYFEQFGDITRLRLSRNKRTGASKHFAFVEFAQESVAKIAAEAMDNYLMFGHILKVKFAPAESLHEDVWKGANKKFRKIPHEKLEREQLEAPKSVEKWQKLVDKEQRRRDKKAEQMATIGLEMPKSTLVQPADVLRKRLEAPQPPQDDEGPAGALEPPPNVPKDEVAVKESKKSKKEKTSKKAKSEAVFEAVKNDVEPAGALQPPPGVPKDELAVEVSRNAKKEKKGKPSKKRKSEALSDEVEAATISAQAVEPPAPVTEDEPAPIASTKPKKEKKSKKVKADATAEKFESEQTTSNMPAKPELANGSAAAAKEDRKALKKAKKDASTNAGEPTTVTKVDTTNNPLSDTPADTQAELSADFISLGDFGADEGQPTSGKKNKPNKVAKPKKERTNRLAKSTKKSATPSTTWKIPGLPTMGKGKYNKETRTAHKELKKKIVAERAAMGLPAHRVRGERVVPAGKME